jgi:hypothetical protein
MHVAAARRDGLIDGSLKPVRVLYVSPLHETMWKQARVLDSLRHLAEVGKS